MLLVRLKLLQHSDLVKSVMGEHIVVDKQQLRNGEVCQIIVEW